MPVGACSEIRLVRWWADYAVLPDRVGLNIILGVEKETALCLHILSHQLGLLFVIISRFLLGYTFFGGKGFPMLRSRIQRPFRYSFSKQVMKKIITFEQGW